MKGSPLPPKAPLHQGLDGRPPRRAAVPRSHPRPLPPPPSLTMMLHDIGNALSAASLHAYALVNSVSPGQRPRVQAISDQLRLSKSQLGELRAWLTEARR